MRILVTGANGFVGNEISKYLDQNDYDLVRLVGNSNNTEVISANKSTKFRKFNVDITNRDDVLSLEEIGEVDVVIHSAGLAHQFGETEKEKFWSVNVEGTRNIVTLAKKLNSKHFVLISSVSVYGKDSHKNSGNLIAENEICNPTDNYSKSKYEAELICREMLDDEPSNKLTILRLATVIGIGDKGNVLRLIKTIDNKRFLWVGKGDNKKSLICIEDIAKAVEKIIEKQTTQQEIYNLTAEPIAMKEIVNIISNELKINVPSIKLPANLILDTLSLIFNITRFKKINSLNKSIKKWVSDDIFDGKKIQKNIDFKPETTIETGLRKEVRWYLDNKC